jgi:hypothetical protein
MSLSATHEQPALDQLVRHARLFGTECVFETGEQEGLPSAELARLRIELDELDAGRTSKHGFSIGKRRRRSADETLWAKETIASLAAAGNFYRNVPGVTFVDVDLRLNNLEGAVTEKAWTAADIKNPRKVEVPGYDESGRFSVAELASDPRNAARRLLDRFFVSFLGDGADVIDELSKPAN